MPVESIAMVVGVFLAFTAFGLGLAYASIVAGARAITFEEEQAALRPAQVTPHPVPLKRAA